MVYEVVLEKTAERYGVSVPGRPGCWSQGASELEAIANARFAIEEYLAARDEMLQGADVREVEVRIPARPPIPVSTRRQR